MSEVTIERDLPVKLFSLAPVTMAKERASLPCGCAVYVGTVVRDGTPEAMSAAIPCGPEHLGMMERFNDRWRDSLANPTDRPALDVVADFLAEVAT